MRKFTDEQMLDALRLFIDMADVPSQGAYDRWRERHPLAPSGQLFRKRFGQWSTALRMIGVEPNPTPRGMGGRTFSDEQIIAAVRECGVRPTFEEYAAFSRARPDLPNENTARDRFGRSWVKVLILAFGEDE